MTSWHGPFDDDLREERAHFGQLRQHLELAEQAFGHAHFEVFGDAVGDFVDGIHLQRDLHAAHAGEGVDEHAELASPCGFSNSRAGPPFLTERSANSVISSFGIDFERDALQFFVLFEGADEVAQVVVCHVGCRSTMIASSTHDESNCIDNGREPGNRTGVRAGTGEGGSEGGAGGAAGGQTRGGGGGDPGRGRRGVRGRARSELAGVDQGGDSPRWRRSSDGSTFW